MSDKVIMGFWAAWSCYRKGKGQFDISKNVDPTLITHFVWSFFEVSNEGEFEWFDRGLIKEIAKVNALKVQNPKLKTLVSVGGWAQGSEKYSNIAADPKKRKTFAETTVTFLKEHGFDGLNLSWVYPAQFEGSRAKDVDNYVTLLREMKEHFKKDNFLLTISVAAAESSARISYDIPKIVQYVDLINVMTYDFNASHDEVLGYNSPLCGPGSDTVQSSIEYWLAEGAPANKLLMDIPFYGNSYTLADNNKVKCGDACKGPARPGPYIGETGKLGYNEISEKVRNDWTRAWDEEYLAAYAYKGDQWCSYDDTQSIVQKMKFVKSKNLRGVGIWTLDADDFHGDCGEKYPLLKAINRGIR